MLVKQLNAAMRLRQIAVTVATAAVAEALVLERIACAELAAVTDELRCEKALATALTAGDAAVAMFAAWLPGGKARQSWAREALDLRIADTMHARVILATARTAEAVLTDLLKDHARRAMFEAAKVDQLGIDEAACRAGSIQAHPERVVEA